MRFHLTRRRDHIMKWLYFRSCVRKCHLLYIPSPILDCPAGGTTVRNRVVCLKYFIHGNLHVVAIWAPFLGSEQGRLLACRQWNLDIIGVPGVEAEAELLAAMITFFQRVGLGPQDVGLKVSSLLPYSASNLAACRSPPSVLLSQDSTPLFSCGYL